MERTLEEIPIEGGEITFSTVPFEIVTLKLGGFRG